MHNINKIAAETLANLNIHQQAQDYEWRGDQDYTPNEKERALLEDFGNGLLATVHDLILAALSAQVQNVAIPEGWQLVPKVSTAEMEDAARHLMMWLDFTRPTEASLLAHCKRLGKEPPPGCKDIDHVPPKAMRLFWVWHTMLAAAPAAKQNGGAP